MGLFVPTRLPYVSPKVTIDSRIDLAVIRVTWHVKHPTCLLKRYNLVSITTGLNDATFENVRHLGSRAILDFKIFQKYHNSSKIDVKKSGKLYYKQLWTKISKNPKSLQNIFKH